MFKGTPYLPLAALVAAPAPALANPPVSGDPVESCDGLSLPKKEACYARQGPDLVAECERMRPHHCAPYARVHESEKQLSQLNAELLQAAKKTYVPYEASQPGYVRDAAQALADSDRAWRAYRDVHCPLIPLIQACLAARRPTSPKHAARTRLPHA